MVMVLAKVKGDDKRDGTMMRTSIMRLVRSLSIGCIDRFPLCTSANVCSKKLVI